MLYESIACVKHSPILFPTQRAVRLILPQAQLWISKTAELTKLSAIAYRVHPPMLRYLLPALVPSWRFFDDIGPSPRIEYCLLADKNATPGWQPFQPPPEHIPLPQLFRRLVWNPGRNEALYLLSSCEKILERDALQAQEVIAGRMAQTLRSGELPPQARYFRFRLLVVEREGDRLVQREQFVSPAFALDQSWGPIP